MVLGTSVPGRVGRRRISFDERRLRPPLIVVFGRSAGRRVRRARRCLTPSGSRWPASLVCVAGRRRRSYRGAPSRLQVLTWVHLMGVPPTVRRGSSLVVVDVRETVSSPEGPRAHGTLVRCRHLLLGGHGRRPGPSRRRNWCPSPSCGSTRARPAARRRSRPRPRRRARSVRRTERVKVEAPRARRAGRRTARASDWRAGSAMRRLPSPVSGSARPGRLLAPIVREVPELAEGRELYGLTLYRLGRWKDAARELDAFVELSNGSTEQHPVLADCRRALRQYRRGRPALGGAPGELTERCPRDRGADRRPPDRWPTEATWAGPFDCCRRGSGSPSARWNTICAVPMPSLISTSAPPTCPRRGRCSPRWRGGSRVPGRGERAAALQ